MAGAGRRGAARGPQQAGMNHAGATDAICGAKSFGVYAVFVVWELVGCLAMLCCRFGPGPNRGRSEACPTAKDENCQ